MTELLDVRLLQELRLGGGPEADQLHVRALEHAGMTAVDFLTVRDLLALSGYDDLALQQLLLVLLREFNGGSLCLRLDHEVLLGRLRELTNEDLPAAAEAILEGLRGNRWERLVSRDPAAAKPLLIIAVGNREYLYFQKTWMHARRLKERLRTRLNEAAGDDFGAAGPAAVRAVLVDEPLPFELNRDQQLALALALRRRFLIVSGGPGTGKTSIIVALLRCLVRLGVTADDIGLVAPTGRAAQRMTESLHRILGTPSAVDAELLKVGGKTIHRLLGYRANTNRFRYNEHFPLPLRLVVVDEVSMVDVCLMERLLAAVPPSAHLVFLGDKDQLPSVDAGAVLADLIPSRFPESFTGTVLQQVQELMPGLELPAAATVPQALTDAIVILKTCYRSERGIMNLAARVNARDAGVGEAMPELPAAAWRRGLAELSGAWFIDLSRSHQERRWILDQWAIQQFLQPVDGTSYRDLARQCEGLDWAGDEAAAEPLTRLFAQLARGQILTFVRRGPFGTDGINHYLDRELRQVFDPRAGGRCFSGMPIMVQQNDRTKELHNGDVGIVLRDREGNLRAVFRRLGHFADHGVENLPPFATAFAITVHKSQGSEYDRVLLVLPNVETHRLLSKEIVYTGLTRARHAAVVMGRREVLAAAVRRRIERETGISMWEVSSAPEAAPSLLAEPSEEVPEAIPEVTEAASSLRAEPSDEVPEAIPEDSAGRTVEEAPPEPLPPRPSRRKRRKSDDDERQLKLFDL